MRTGSNFFTYPVDGESIRGAFTYADRTAGDFTPEDDATMAEQINHYIVWARESAWFSSERDGRAATFRGEPLELNGQPVRFRHPGELAVILCEE